MLKPTVGVSADLTMLDESKRKADYISPNPPSAFSNFVRSAETTMVGSMLERQKRGWPKKKKKKSIQKVARNTCINKRWKRNGVVGEIDPESG